MTPHLTFAFHFGLIWSAAVAQNVTRYYTIEGIRATNRSQEILEIEKKILRNYDNRLMPPSEGPLHVYLKPLLYALLSIDESRETLTIYLYLRFHWVDQRLTWNPDSEALEFMYLPIDSVWRPDILVENMVDMFYPARFQPPMMVRVHHTGNVSWNFPASISTLCQLDLRRFPYDRQTCTLNFVSWTLDAAGMILHPVEEHMVLDNYEDDDEWTLLNTSAKELLLMYDCCPNPWSIAAYSLVYQRDPHFYIIYLVMPAYILCVLSVIGLFSASTSGPERLERVTLGITSMLTMSVFLTMVAQQIPKISSYVPSIGRFFLAQVGLLAAASVTAVLIMHVERRQLRDGRVPGCLRWILHWPPIPRRKKSHKKISTVMDATTSNGHASIVTDEVELRNRSRRPEPQMRGVDRRRSTMGAIFHDLFDTEAGSSETSREENASEWHFLAGRLDTYAMVFYIILINILTAAYLDITYI